ncbi:MAG: hypothetical protein ACI4KR_07965 [Ruminiclostridium sp.]
MPDLTDSSNDRVEIGENIRLMQEAINRNTQIGFNYNRYNPDKSLNLINANIR